MTFAFTRKDASKLAEATVTMIKQIAAREYRSDQRQHLARQRSHGGTGESPTSIRVVITVRARVS